MADQYANRAAKVAVGQLAEAAGFDAVHQSSLDTLADLLLRYINEIGSASHSYAGLAGRTESNPLDVVSSGPTRCWVLAALCGIKTTSLSYATNTTHCL